MSPRGDRDRLEDILAAEPGIDWSAIARARDFLAHRCWDTSHAVLRHAVERELEQVRAAVIRMLGES